MRQHAAFLVALAAALAVASAGAATSTRPALRVVDRAPLTVKGVHFERSERVRVRASVDGVRAARLVRARAPGSFVVSFSALVVDRCSSVFVVAIGSAGSRASAKTVETLCPPSLTP